MSYLSARFIFILAVLLTITACLGPVKKLYPEKKDQRPVPVYIINLGWHVGIAIEEPYLRKKLPEHDRFPHSGFLMIGWGDNKYYPSDRVRLDLFLRAALLPTGSVIHVVGVDESVESHFRHSEIVRVQISKKGMEKMTAYLAEQFSSNAEGNLKYAADGLYKNSAFFEAKGLYFFPKTSNKWTARVLRESGFPISPFYALTSGNLMHQVKKSGKVIQR